MLQRLALRCPQALRRPRCLSRPVHGPANRRPVRARQQQALSVRVRAAESGQQAALAAVTYDIYDIDRAKAAIDLGLGLTREQRWGEALAVFEKALTLPGTGLKRYRDKPPSISDGEKQAALYNMACCHAQLNDVRTGLVSLANCFEAGYEDFAQVRADPDLAALRADERFEGLMQRFEPKPRQKLFGLF